MRVAAPQSVLDELTGIPVSTIDLEGADETFTVTLPLKKNPDIVWMDVSDVDVVVRVKEEEATKTFKGLPVTYRNLGAGLTAELYNATVDIEVTMAKSALEKLTNDDISVYVDLTGYEAMGDSVAPLFCQHQHGRLVQRLYAQHGKSGSQNHQNRLMTRRT